MAGDEGTLLLCPGDRWTSDLRRLIKARPLRPLFCFEPRGTAMPKLRFGTGVMIY